MHQHGELGAEPALGGALCGRSAVACSSSASSSADRKVNHRRYRITSASAVLTKYWYQAYGLVICRVQPQAAAAGGFAELVAVGGGHQRHRQRMHRRTELLAHQVAPRR